MLEDLTAFLGEFSAQVTTASRASFAAIYDEEGVTVGEVAVDSTAPTLTARARDVEDAEIAVGTVLTVQDELTLYGSFTVRRLIPDQPGWTVLRLERV